MIKRIITRLFKYASASLNFDSDSVLVSGSITRKGPSWFTGFCTPEELRIIEEALITKAKESGVEYSREKKFKKVKNKKI